VLLTNNRAKLYGFTKTGIEIAIRMPLEAPINADNRFDDLTASLGPS